MERNCIDQVNQQIGQSSKWLFTQNKAKDSTLVLFINSKQVFRFIILILNNDIMKNGYITIWGKVGRTNHKIAKSLSESQETSKRDKSRSMIN